MNIVDVVSTVQVFNSLIASGMKLSLSLVVLIIIIIIIIALFYIAPFKGPKVALQLV